MTETTSATYKESQNNNQQLSLSERHTENLHRFQQILAQRRFWHVLPHGESDIAKGLAIFDRKTGMRMKNLSEFQVYLKANPFTYLRSIGDTRTLATLHSSTRLLWNNEISNKQYGLKEGELAVAEGRWASIDGWALPSHKQLQVFAKAENNPHSDEKKYRLKTASGAAQFSWLTAEGRTDTDEGYWLIADNTAGAIFAVNQLWKNKSALLILCDLTSQGLCLVTPQDKCFSPEIDLRWQGITDEELLLMMQLEGVSLCSFQEDAQAKELCLQPMQLDALFSLVNVDFTPCRLPKLDYSQLTDPEKGLWELWGEPADFLKRNHYVARDPARDIQRRAVAIDFGTSSTVVAMDTANGGRELLRIGVRDFRTSPEPQHFENPTVLECLDFTAFNTAWTERAYRPELDWNWMRAAHEAQASFRDNPGETSVLASILPKLKQWALRSNVGRVRLTDRQGKEIELAPHAERNPVRGQPLPVTSEYPFDPIELYAWYLGMAINWRERGLFLTYYLSFPVKYPREVRDRILASFRRGLQRSLPQKLVEYHPQILNEFKVEGLASEPAAYAAAALAHLQIEPTDEGVPYAVFDFGGGTTDFDYGLLRWAKADEETRGYEEVFEHLASEGDRFLGGENLLEHLVYASFQHNLAILRDARIQFTKPIDATSFVGSEAFIAPTQAAQTNSVMLAAKLRPFLESNDNKLEPQIKLDLIDTDGSKKTCELALDGVALDDLLANRIRGGVEAFFYNLAQLRSELPSGSPIHILLAGNGCRSRHIKALFNSENSTWSELLKQAFGDNPPDIIIHPPLPMDDANPHAPTAKTGVALGLLRLVPGENTLLVDHVNQRNDGQAPFAWFVGRMRRRQFDPVLMQGAVYGTWSEIGALQQNVFNLYVSSSPRSHKGLPEGDPELNKYRIEFAAASADARLFARATGPNTIELVATLSQENIDDAAVKTLTLS